MVILIKLLGMAVAVMGVIFMVNKKTIKDYILYWREKKKLRLGGIISIAFGALFLMAAPQCRLAGLITVLGIWALIKGVLLLTLKEKKIYAYFDWLLGKPVSATKYLGIIVLVFGLLLIYSA